MGHTRHVESYPMQPSFAKDAIIDIL